jgi:hypothetical protein
VAPFESLDFLHVPSRDVAAEAEHLVRVVGAEHFAGRREF